MIKRLRDFMKLRFDADAIYLTPHGTLADS
jgi:hypothetical protein